MGLLAPFFSINPILAIGGSNWEPACGLPGFFYHEVAWKGDCTLDDPVFDACLLVDGDLDPTRSPHTPFLPANMRFGNPGEGSYRDRLATPSARVLCIPRPETRHRKLVY
jgi:hypothetical protein